ncbi:hypothetical protein A6V39_00115 [Candidatus Mycoplasma haematobovis]|uniref:Uncharacterized protein n=1 Tax=Candidatus Mycoplasma haematobovis TaxID=432608 RepID=A0A1A9QDB2_9MOLU|nr:hypothetical protein [Candidatus Mycoplasma haematobovis]OAL10453.1 hypothetical protein A6V39_00115 [Candidatus Mycoplasma haematobovis]
MSALTRVAIGVGAIGGTAGGGYLLHRQLSTDNIEKKLTTNKYQILGDSDKEWTNILISYRATVVSNKDLQFDDFTGTENSENTLKEKCKDILQKSANIEKDYKKAAQWCVIPKTLPELLIQDKYEKLDTNEGDDLVNQKEWNDKITEHNKKDKNQTKRFTDLEGVTGDTMQQNEAGRKAIKKKCKELESKKHYEQDFSANLEKAKLWCAIEKSK